MVVSKLRRQIMKILSNLKKFAFRIIIIIIAWIFITGILAGAAKANIAIYKAITGLIASTT